MCPLGSNRQTAYFCGKIDSFSFIICFPCSLGFEGVEGPLKSSFSRSPPKKAEKRELPAPRQGPVPAWGTAPRAPARDGFVPLHPRTSNIVLEGPSDCYSAAVDAPMGNISFSL